MYARVMRVEFSDVDRGIAVVHDQIVPAALEVYEVVAHL